MIVLDGRRLLSNNIQDEIRMAGDMLGLMKLGGLPQLVAGDC